MTEINKNRYGMKTVEILNRLQNEGVKKMSVLMRHSARHYDEEHREREPLLWLTEEGKLFAHAFGEKIPHTPVVRFFSSMLGRCIETAYQADKGYTNCGGQTESNTVVIELAPFFVKDPPEIFKLHVKLGTSQLFKEWFAGKISDDIAGRSDKVAEDMIKRLAGLLQAGPESHIDISVSHDWNLFMIKHHYLNLAHEKTTQVEYMEGIIIFEKDNGLFITNHETDPLQLDLALLQA